MGHNMASDSSAKAHLQQYITERLPQLTQGYFENPEDPPSIADDRRYMPLKPFSYEG